MSNRVSSIISDSTLNRMIGIESAGKPRAKAPTSSATGLGQFIDGTWMQMIRMHRPDLLKGRTEKQVLALRYDTVIMIDILARFTEGNARILGPGFTDGDLYLAHFAGVGTAQRLKRASAGTPVSTIMSASAINANRSILLGQTAGEVRAWASRKMAQQPATDWIGRFYKQGTPLTLTASDEFDSTDELSDARQPTLAENPGDPEIYGLQESLKLMGYNPGLLDGRWGGATSGALAAFFNDVPGDVAVEAPTSESSFNRDRSAILRIVNEADANNFKRPISIKRANADAKVVAEAAPESVPMQNSTKASIGAFLASIGTGIFGMFKSGWELFTGNRDLIDTSWFSYLTYVPVWVWALGISGVLAYIVIKSRQANQIIVESVQSGERL